MLSIRFFLTIIILSISVSGYCQTPSDTASIIGTGKRSIPKPIPVKPDLIEIYEPVSIPSFKKVTKSSPTTKLVGDQNESPRITSADSVTQKAYYDALTAYYKAIERKNLNDANTMDLVGTYYSWALKNRQSIIQRQQITGSVIFILVTILLLSGLLFSALQFRIALKNVKRKSISNADTTFKASLAGIEVSSSILGVIVLAISLGFFYLYLTNVYPLVSLDQLPSQIPGK